MQNIQSCTVERFAEFKAPLEINDNSRKGEIDRKEIGNLRN